MRKQTTSRIIKIAKALGLTALIGLAALLLLALWYAKDLPDPEQILSKGFAQSTKIYDRTGQVLLYQVGEERRTVINIQELPEHVRLATLAAEDADFYKHPGIDVTGILRAAWYDVQKQELEQGGSTITQQFVKNALLTSEKTFSRKIKEMMLSFWLEIKYSKDEILGFYLNQIPYGGSAYGIEQGSRTYFGKSAKELTLPEAAALAALPWRPTRLSPYGEHKDELLARKDLILNRMAKEGFITNEERDKAKKEELKFSAAPNSFIAPHFVIYIKEYLESTYGAEVVEKGGLEVITSLDVRLQEQAEEAVAEVAKSNETKYRASNASLVGLDPKTGQILAMVGSRDWFDDKVDGKVNVALRLRQPGSSFKPIVYSKLFEQGLGPESLVFDLTTTFRTRAGQPYTPINYDGRAHGLLTMRQALAHSRNIPAVKALYLVGVDNAIAHAKKMGIDTIDPGRVDLALVLGGAEVRLLDLTAAYGVFANDGTYYKPNGILRVKTNNGQILEEFKAQGSPVMDAEVTRLITSILSDNATRAAVFGPNSPLYIPGVASAAKTGTTSDFKDGWTLGYTPNLVVGVWAGNNDNTPTKNGEGAFIAGPIWNRVVRFAATKYPTEFGGAFPPLKPHKLLDKPMANGKLGSETKIMIDKSTGLPASTQTPDEFKEERIYKQAHSLLYYMRPNDPQVGAWEAPIQAWVGSQPDSYLYGAPPTEEQQPPKEKPSKKVDFDVTNMRDGEEVTNTVTIEYTFDSDLPLKQVDIFIDDTLIKTSAQSPVEISLAQFSAGKHELRLRAFNEALAWSEKKFTIKIVR